MGGLTFFQLPFFPCNTCGELGIGLIWNIYGKLRKSKVQLSETDQADG